MWQHITVISSYRGNPKRMRRAIPREVRSQCVIYYWQGKHNFLSSMTKKLSCWPVVCWETDMSQKKVLFVLNIRINKKNILNGNTASSNLWFLES